jgi:GR25 family glycosyltransferase involved in LPS biosynthesis
MNFNWEVYRELNPDLAKAGLKVRLEFVNHYSVHGVKENRKYSVYQLYPDFNPISYSLKYEDLRNFSIQNLELHWIKYGRKEGRTYKPNKSIKPIKYTKPTKHTKPITLNNKYGLINGVDIIYWINLDRSKDRRVFMENILNRIKVQNKRISASDGKIIPNIASNFITITPKNQTPGVYGCLLSHLRTIKDFYTSNKNIALVLEDDISLEFMPFWNKDLKTIIGQAPVDWDIIMMHYTDYDPNNHRYLFNRWNPSIYSTMAYIINRKGAQKIMNLNKNGKWFINTKDHVSDALIYSNCNTVVYRYPYFTINSNMESLLHNEHLKIHNSSKIFAKNMWINNIN